MDRLQRERLAGAIDLKKIRALGLGWVLVSAVTTVLALLLPATHLFGGGQHAAAVVHLVLEVSSLVMASLVIFIAWNSLSRASSVEANTLILGFSLIVGADLMDLLSYEAMQFWFFPSDASNTIYFHLVGRSVQLATLLLLALRVHLPGPKYLWLNAAFLGVLIMMNGRLTHTQWISSVLDTTAGAAGFKVAAEYVLAVIATGVAMTFYRRFHRTEDVRDFWFALGAFFAGLSELVMPAHAHTFELSVFIGHALNIGSYACIYKAVYIVGIELPFHRLIRSENAVKAREHELRTILENIPASIARVGRDKRLIYANPEFQRTLAPVSKVKLGLTLSEALDSDAASTVESHLEKSLQGKQSRFEFISVSSHGQARHLYAIFSPVKTESGDVDGALAIFTDKSEREAHLKKLSESTKEVAELKAALDAHAIVAVTDARGVITRVNDKFCQISQYGRSELIGVTHRIINSGHHPKTFFASLWRTISRGEVWSGEICNRAKDGSLYWVHTTIVPFMGADGVPVQYIAIRADITQRKQAEAQAQRMALHDVLTGLPNRRLIGDRLLQTLHTVKRERKYGALLLLDMDHFKDVNDTMGHAAGDDLLRQTTSRLLSNVRQNDTVGRLGGDEFVVILESLDPDHVTATANAADLAEKFRGALCHAYYVNGHAINISPSIGVVMLHGEKQSPEEMLKHADIAMYKAKEAGRNRIAFFDPKLQAEITERTQLQEELRHAIARNELRLHYQPVVNQHLNIQGVECLVRWQHPTRGLVPPNLFIPLAEQSILIQSIGKWVLRQACQQLVLWAKEKIRSDWTIAVNVSAKQFHDDHFIQQVTDILKETGAPANRLRLELTESMLHKSLELTKEKMRQLQQLEVRFSLDDFGTGYSSLSYLKMLPLDQLKIDKSFVQDVLTDPDDAAIARTILALAENLNMNVVAEGVETQGQFQFLVESGCTGFQGYLFSKPVPVHQLRDHLSGDIAGAAIENLGS